MSAVDAAIREIRDHIRNGRWALGDRLPPEPDLTRELGISRASLREATRALVHSGLLTTRQGDGTFVAAIDENAVALERRLSGSSMRELLEVRRGLDTSAARLASARHTARDLREMRASLEQRRKASRDGDFQAFADGDVRFHLAVTRASHNELLIDLYKSLTAILRRSVDTPQSLEQDVHDDDDHERLYRAIEAGDEAGSVGATIAILDSQTLG